MTTITLASGTIDYDDSGGSGPVMVLIHGMLMSGSLWDDVVADLRTDHRCIVPTLPLGSHRHPMPPEADMSPFGVARIDRAARVRRWHHRRRRGPLIARVMATGPP